MTQLAANCSDTDRVIVVDENASLPSGALFRIDDELLRYISPDQDSVTDLLAVKHGDTTRWRAARGQAGTTAASHTTGAAIFGVVEGVVTGETIAVPEPFAGGTTPTLAEVLAEGNDAEEASLHEVAAIGGDTNAGGGSYGLLVTGGPLDGSALPDGGNQVLISGGSGVSATSGGQVSLVGGGGNGDLYNGAAIQVEGGGADGAPGNITIYGGGTAGNPGDVLTSDGTYATWQSTSAEIVITEDVSGAAGTYTGSVTVPGGATITGVHVTLVNPKFGWEDGSGGFGVLNVGDEGDAGGFVKDFDMSPWGIEPEMQTFVVPMDASDNTLDGDYAAGVGGGGVYQHLYSATDHEVLAVLDVVDTFHHAGQGEVRVLITWAKPTPVSATFEAAA